MGRYTSGGVGRDVLAGAVAGVAAIWVANKLDRMIYKKGNPKSIRDTEAARPGGMDPAHVLAKRAADAVGLEVADPRDNAAGHTIQYGIAASMGALYGLMRGMAPGVTAGRGAIFGLAMFILKDEIGNTALGTAGNPLAYPVRDHARGAATHTLFGVVTDLVTRLLSPWRDEVVITQGPPLSERLDRGRQYLGQTRDQLYERGRQTLDQGRTYLDQGIGYAGQVAGTVAARLPDYDEATRLARAGRKQATHLARDIRGRLPDIDPAELARTSRRQAIRFANDARAYVPEIPESGVSRALKRVFG